MLSEYQSESCIILHARLATDSRHGAQIAWDERNDRASSSKNRNSEYGRRVKHPSRRERSGGGRVEVDPNFWGARHPNRDANRAASRSTLRGYGWICDGGKSGGDDEIVAEEELARCSISVGFVGIRELEAGGGGGGG
jgi:hypothetical protein